jgi:hypothetical protein
MPAVKIIAFLGLEPRLNIKYRFNWADKIEHFSKVSPYLTTIFAEEDAAKKGLYLPGSPYASASGMRNTGEASVMLTFKRFAF